jgi:hypothetical protein
MEEIRISVKLEHLLRVPNTILSKTWVYSLWFRSVKPRIGSSGSGKTATEDWERVNGRMSVQDELNYPSTLGKQIIHAAFKRWSAGSWAFVRSATDRKYSWHTGLPSPVKEIGWSAVDYTHGQLAALLGYLPEAATVFQWRAIALTCLRTQFAGVIDQLRKTGV